MSAETDPKLVEEIDAIPAEAGVEQEAEALAARSGKNYGGSGGGGAIPQGGPYQTHGEPGGGESDPNGGPYQPHQPDPAKPGPVVPTGGPYQTHSVDQPIAAQN
ncbi:hypothetical protein [Actinosynnema sp. NPDC023587]|uniref:hypothetical protein n=1 Tax=Actinosynnema sp. NPDC023587 TaxID=3154695 RepID=UPI0033E268DA